MNSITKTKLSGLIWRAVDMLDPDKDKVALINLQEALELIDTPLITRTINGKTEYDVRLSHTLAIQAKDGLEARLAAGEIWDAMICTSDDMEIEVSADITDK